MKGTTHLGISPPERDEIPHYTQLHDCTLVSGDGVAVKASTYVMVQACFLLSSMFEDMQSDEKRVFHLPNVDYETLTLLVDILHNRRAISSIADVDEIRRVIVAMDYLGCRPKFKKLVTRLWQLLRLLPNTRETFEILCDNATLIMPEFSAAFLNKAKLIRPVWHEFKVLFESFDMTPQLAVLCMNTLSPVFPPLLITYAIMKSSPRTHLYQILSSVLSIPRIGLQFHPDEFMEVLEWCTESAPPIKKNDQANLLAKACLDSYKGVNSPLCISKISSTFIFYQHNTRCSFLLTLKKPVTKKTKVQFQHGTAVFDVSETGEITTSVQLHRLHDSAESVNEAYVRTVAINLTELGSSELDFDNACDTWQTIDQIDHRNRGTIVTTTQLAPLTFPLVRYIRIDVFWLHDPRMI